MALTNDQLKHKRLSDESGFGKAGTGVTAVEKASGETFHVTELTFSDLDLITPAGAASLASGTLVYTLPDGLVMLDKVYINISLSTAGSTVTNDTPDLGLGTTVGSGAVAVLGGTAAFENILTGQTMDDVNGTAEIVTAASTLTLESTDDHTIYLNIADGWAGGEATGVQAEGKIILVWKAL